MCAGGIIFLIKSMNRLLMIAPDLSVQRSTCADFYLGPSSHNPDILYGSLYFPLSLNNPKILYGSFHLLFHCPYITPIYYMVVSIFFSIIPIKPRCTMVVFGTLGHFCAKRRADSLDSSLHPTLKRNP